MCLAVRYAIMRPGSSSKCRGPILGIGLSEKDPMFGKQLLVNAMINPLLYSCSFHGVV